MTIYKTYINMMNDRIKALADLGNPFKFKNIANLKGMSDFDDSGPCVVMASPGMLQSGLSRELFEKWCSDRRNGVLIASYCVEGTLAKHIMSEPSEITTSSGLSVPLNMSVDYISFSAHSDFIQTSEFIDILQPPHVVLVHGDANEMSRLKQSLVAKYEGKNVTVHSPKNCQTLDLEFRSEKVAKIVGSLATPLVESLVVKADPSQKEATADATDTLIKPTRRDVTVKVSGVIVRKDFAHSIMSPEELGTFTQLKTNIMNQKLSVPYNQTFFMLVASLSRMFDEIVQENKEGLQKLIIFGCVSLSHVPTENQITVEWESNPINDMIADSAISILLQLESNPASIKALPPLTEKVKEGTVTNEKDDSALTELLGRIRLILEAQFGPMEIITAIEDIDAEIEEEQDAFPGSLLQLDWENSIAQVDLLNKRVVCDNAPLRERVSSVLQRAHTAVFPICK
eukprot:TRINITY_DN5921_c0_g1_i1.p1 TRINITY_DN5921_c0_g1~~TRINITY_DN5921_c0_g1_i1.p1  ORF type:complete len:456 (+),score=43.02 TRINITY_DN5921_c0_g1_i1:186-1553(+)